MYQLLQRYIFLALKKEEVCEGRIGAGKNYLLKEEIREKLQELITDRVRSRDIKSQEDLDSFFKDVEMASRALRGIPYEVFIKLANK